MSLDPAADKHRVPHSKGSGPRHVGLTGGLATGKTYVRKAFARLGIPTFDADAAARDAVAPGTPGLRAVVERFGVAVITEDQMLNRDHLAQVVFADPLARTDLEAIVHPLVQQARRSWVEGLGDAHVPFVLSEVPLLYEAGLDAEFDQVVVVACAPELQRERARQRSGLTPAAIEQRLEAQWAVAEKVRRADFVIWTDGSFDDTDAQVLEVFDRLCLTGVESDQRS